MQAKDLAFILRSFCIISYMIQIDPSYEVILTYSPGIHEITGHIFECFDYYLFLRKYYKVGILFLDALKHSFLKEAFENKYIFEYDDIKKDILTIDAEKLKDEHIIKFGHKTVVILTDGNIISLKNNNLIFSTKYQLAFSCLGIDAIKTTLTKNMIFLQDYRIYSKNKHYMSYNYVKKIPFEYYKKFNRQFDNTGLMYITYNCRKITRAVIEEYHKLSKCNKTILVVPYKISEYDNIENVHQTVAPIKDFFNQFDTYIYTPVERKFDCSPRLITECFFYNKKIYMNLDYVDIGLQTRYNDCLNNFEKLNLTDNDEILDIIKNLVK